MAEGGSVKEKTSLRDSDSTERTTTCNVFTDVVSEKSAKREEHILDRGKAPLLDRKYTSPRHTHVQENAAAGRNWPSRGARAVSLINISESPQMFTIEQNSHALSTSLPNGLDLRMPFQQYSDWVPEGPPNAGTQEHSVLSTQRLSDPDPQGLSQLSARDHSNSHTEEQSARASRSPGDTSELPGSSLSSSDMQPHSHDGHAPPHDPNEATPHDQLPQEEEGRRLSISSLFLSQFANKRNRTPSICVHRASLPREGPPCYSCSTFDLPPKYHKVDEPGWKRARSRILRMYRGLVSFGQPEQQADLPLPPEGDWNTPPYTIALGSRQEPSSYTNNSSDGGATAEYPSGSPQSAVASSVLVTQTHRPSMSDVPPPYSPPTPASLMAGQSLPQLTEDQFFAMRRPTPVEMDQVTFNFHQGYCNKSCHCNFVYSLLLAIITSVSLLGPDQPLIILISAVFFLTVFLYMPIIWALECLLHWRTHGNCRDMRMTGLGTVSPVTVL
ncbi:uncharacterized protein LOC125025098 isoform X1 [Penaeus chinensis]|uniref:uncharacterized protein LOC125025098 isoform X1 n=1 Tax=Penaeus chinensis TaxID=139456 RepID=UPI001FB74302|nr:uncharacterized protein LOC125025098 isoform X1 [Penaeus chinensis]